MAISGLFFLLTRLFQLTTLIPIVGMLSYFVHIYVKANALTPNYILIMFIVSVLAAAWVLATTVLYWTARYSAHVVAAFDLAFVGAFIAAVYFLRGPGTTNCNHLDFYAGGGSAGVSYSGNKDCTMLKACFALGIIETILFFWTFLLALLVARNHSEPVVVRRTYHSSRHSHRRSSPGRGSYEYSRRSGGGSRQASRSSHTRRSYYV